MILKELYITDKIRCPFHSGLNIILGSNVNPKEKESKRVIDVNGVGKTRIIKAICHVLGGDTGKAFESEFFTKKSYWASLHIIKSKKHHVISRPLWSPFSDQVILIFNGDLKDQNAYLEKQKISLSNIKEMGDVNRYFSSDDRFQVLIKEEAKRFLSRLEEIDYSEGNLSFSNLLDYIARDEMLGFSSTISRQARKEWSQHRCIQYLFGLPATIEQQSEKLKQEISSIYHKISFIKEYLKEKEIKNISSIQNKKIKLRKKLEQVQKNVKTLKVQDAIESVRKKYMEKRSLLVDVNTQLNTKETQIKSHKKNLEDIKSKESSIKSLLDTKSFYNDLLEFFPEKISDNFENYDKFFNSISSDRREYYKDLIQELELQIKSLKSQKKLLSNELDGLANSLKETNIIGDISSLASQEEEIKNDLRELDKAHDKFSEWEDLDSQKDTITERRKSLIKEGKDLEKKNRKKRENIIELFQNIVNEVYLTEDAVLNFEYNDNLQSSIAGRTEVLCSIPSQQSKGRTHAKICIFDYIWLLRERENDEYNPFFLIHDGPFGSISPEPKKRMLTRMIEELADTEKQYIITANDFELPNVKKFRKYACIELDGSKVSGKFFGEQYE